MFSFCFPFFSGIQGNSSSQLKLAPYSSILTNRHIVDFYEISEARNHQGKYFTIPWPAYEEIYMKDGIDFIHRKVLFNLNDEEIDHLLVRLKQINRIVAFTYENLAVFTRQKFHKFFMNDCRMSELKRTVDQRNVLRKLVG